MLHRVIHEAVCRQKPSCRAPRRFPRRCHDRLWERVASIGQCWGMRLWHARGRVTCGDRRDSLLLREVRPVFVWICVRISVCLLHHRMPCLCAGRGLRFLVLSSCKASSSRPCLHHGRCSFLRGRSGFPGPRSTRWWSFPPEMPGPALGLGLAVWDGSRISFVRPYMGTGACLPRWLCNESVAI